MLNQLIIINRGVGYRADRKLGPSVISTFMGHPRADDELNCPADISFAELDILIAQGLVAESSWKEYSCAILTYAGRRKLLTETGWRFDTWADRGYACCDQAIPVFCVCRVSMICSTHMKKCVGSHS